MYTPGVQVISMLLEKSFKLNQIYKTSAILMKYSNRAHNIFFFDGYLFILKILKHFGRYMALLILPFSLFVYMLCQSLGEWCTFYCMCTNTWLARENANNLNIFSATTSMLLESPGVCAEG